VAAVVSLGVATAVVPQQGYAANILTPSVTRVSFPLQNVRLCIYIHKHTVPVALLSPCPSSNPLILPPPRRFLSSSAGRSSFFLLPSSAIVFVEGRFLAGAGPASPRGRCCAHGRQTVRPGIQTSLPQRPLAQLGRWLSSTGTWRQRRRRWMPS